MTRVIVIGDSQAGAFKEGWTQVASQYPGVRLEVFAAPFPNFSRLRLTPALELGFPPDAASGPGPEMVERINGRPSIRLADADAVLWAGYRTGFDVIERLLVSRDVDGLRDAGAPQQMSAAAFSAMTAALAARFVPSTPWQGWASPTLFLAARPFAAEGCKASRDPRFALARKLAQNPQGLLAAHALYHEGLGRELARHNIALLPQPAETFTSEALTRDAFSRGSRRVVNASLHPGSDYIHMNADYGAVCIAALMTMLSTPSRPAAQFADT